MFAFLDRYFERLAALLATSTCRARETAAERQGTGPAQP
jgi:hypothetical protein